MMAAQFITSTVKNPQVSGERPHKAQHGTAERGLPRSIGTDDGDEFAGLNIDRNILKGDDAGKAECCAVEMNDGVRWVRTLRNSS